MGVTVETREELLEGASPKQPVKVRAPKKERKSKPAPAKKKAGKLRSLWRILKWRRFTMLKLIVSVVIGAVLYVFLARVPVLNNTAVIIAALGTIGVFTYKGLIAFGAAAFVAKRL